MKIEQSNGLAKMLKMEDDELKEQIREIKAMNVLDLKQKVEEERKLNEIMKTEREEALKSNREIFNLLQTEEK
jgi:hypothetical protein